MKLPLNLCNVVPLVHSQVGSIMCLVMYLGHIMNDVTWVLQVFLVFQHQTPFAR